MKTLTCLFQGRFGNAMLQWLFAKGWAEAHGYELRHEPFIGERVFQIEGIRPDGREVHRVNENELCALGVLARMQDHPPVLDYEFRGYAQMQQCADYYTKRQARDWLKIRPEWLPALNRICAHHNDVIVGHRRVGDYAGYDGYTIVSLESYRACCRQYGLELSRLHMLTEESPTPHADLPDDLSFLPDFYRMMTAPVLLRGNSTFSFLAGVLSDGVVLAPVVNGLAGRTEHDCKFVPGNWPRFANFDFTTDMEVSP